MRNRRLAADYLRLLYYKDSVASPLNPVTPAAHDIGATAGPRPRRELSLHHFFSPGGLLAQTHPAYEFRRGQLQMAQAVEQALKEKRHLIAEAGTGTGKTLAYLVPAILSGKRIIISTGTKNLQEQIFYKDVPFLDQVFFPKGEDRLRVCYMKGRQNYLCRQKLYDLRSQPILNGLDEMEQFSAIEQWEAITTTGDRAELGTLPENSLLWPKLDARTEKCIGQKCNQFDRCFITEMRRKAMESDIVIVNHHLFFADLAIRQETDGAPDVGILPEFGAVIFDEAHELEDVASSYFGVTVSNLRVDEIARDAENALIRNRLVTGPLTQAITRLRERSNFFFSVLPPGEGRFAFQNRRDFLEENGDEFTALRQALSGLGSELEGICEKPEEVHQLIRRAGELKVQLSFLLENEDRNTVFWIERRGGLREEKAPANLAAPDDTSALREASRQPRGRPAQRRGHHQVFLQATPIDVSAILRQSLFERLECAILTSATLSVSGNYNYIQQRLGLEHARELVVPSHFDYAKQALLYLPPDLPDPREQLFARRAADRIRRILEVTRGRAFCLFTSYALMHDIHDRLLGELEHPMLRQGDAPRSALLTEFRETPGAVLFATSSFWQGVDVQGDQLSCVIIDRLPFAVPSDPVVAARVRAIDDAGGKAFFDYQVPSAVISLKQGFGRLIRSLNDRGLLVLLDNRITKKQYGKTFLDSLPPYRRTSDMADVEEFFESS